MNLITFVNDIISRSIFSFLLSGGLDKSSFIRWIFLVSKLSRAFIIKFFKLIKYAQFNIKDNNFAYIQ